MQNRDIQFLSELGFALWESPSLAQAAVRDIVSAITVAESDPLVASEKAVRALLFQAQKTGMYVQPRGPQSQPSANADALLAFQNLFPEERVILLSLHSGRWSYAKLARVLDETMENIQALAWNARVHLTSGRFYPAGSKPVSPSCPEYDPQKPWTQKYLDDAYRGQEKLFLQDHLRSCSSCRDALIRAKHVFYAVNSLVSEIGRDFRDQADQTGLTFQLAEWVEEGKAFRLPPRKTKLEILVQFLTRWEVALIVVVWAAFVFLVKR